MIRSRKTRERRGMRAALLGAALGVLVAVAPSTLGATAQAQSLQALPPGLAPAAAAIERAAAEAFAGSDRVGKDGPLAPVGLELARIHAAAAVPGGLAALRAASADVGGPIIRGDHVLIDATAVGDGADLLRELQALGLRNGVAFGRMVSGELPIAALPSAAALVDLRGARPARAARSVGDVDSQGDASMRADAARLDFGVDGSGLAVGTLSDSYDCDAAAITRAADDVASGDLPTGVVVLEELGGCFAGSDEGRAMMQLIHDVAPGASQLFHSAFNGQAGFAQGILDLEAAGADVIVDDVYYFAEPMFQDGIIAQAVDAVVASGVPYFSSLGNGADASYESAFRSTPAAAPFVATWPNVHDFDPGPGVDTVQQILVEPGATITLILQWDDPFASAGVGNPGAAGDLDLLLTDPTGANVIASATNDNVLTGDPVEIVQVTNSGATPVAAGVVIAFYGGVPPSAVKYVAVGSMSVETFATNSATGFGHANAAGAIAVGAACYCDTPAFGQDPPLREPFTSLGGVPIYFDVAGDRLGTPLVREKPAITAPDGTDTTFFGFDSDGTIFPNFFGTSAAAPHAAAVAALLLDLAPASTPTEILAALTGTAIDMDAPGVDLWTGHGLIQADAALLSLAGTVGFAATSYDAAEGDATATITVERSGGTAGAISVDYATNDGSATAGHDYAAVSGRLDWTDGDASPKTIDVPLLDDADVEGDEALTLVLTAPVGTAIEAADTTLTLTDDDTAALTVSKGPASPAAGLAAAPGDAVVVLQLIVAAPSDVPTATVDALSASITTRGSAGAPTDVAEVRLYVDANGDGAIDAGANPVAIGAPDADGDLVLAPTGLDVAADTSRALIVELVFDAGLAELPSGAPLVALAMPLLFGLVGLRRRSLVALGLLVLALVTACSSPAVRSADVTIEVVALDASTAVPGISVEPSGLPIVGSTVTVTE